MAKGTFHNDEFDFDDWGLTIDAAFALAADGSKPRKLAQITRQLEKKYESYISFDGNQFAGAWGKLLLRDQGAARRPARLRRRQRPQPGARA